MDENMSSAEYLKYKYLTFKQGIYDLVMFSAPAAEIWEIFSINRRVEDKDEGYQRTLSESRVRAIAKYIKESNPIPLSILVSIEKDKYKMENGFLFLKKERDVAWVIDGQHRLAGAHESDTNLKLPIIAFLDLDTEGQIRQFVTVNKEAKGVPSSLYLDLLKHLPIGTPAQRAKDRATDIARELKQDEESPFYSKIAFLTAPKQGEISLTTFVKKVSPFVLEDKGLFAAYSMVEQVKVISNFYSGLKNIFPKAFKASNPVFFQTTGFGASMRILPTVFSLTLTREKGFRISDVTRILNEVPHYDFDGWRKFGTGNMAEIQACEDFREELENVLKTPDGIVTKISL